MAHLWMMSDECDWQPYVLTCTVAIGPAGLLRAATGADLADASDVVLLHRQPLPHEDTWVLLAESKVPALVNGLPVVGGIAILADRDELRLPVSSPMFFSTERLATTEAFPGSGSRAFCPRCKQVIAVGELAVRCPGCGLWHHGTEQLPCWTYGERCAVCSQPTAAGTGFQWTPEEL